MFSRRDFLYSAGFTLVAAHVSKPMLAWAGQDDQVAPVPGKEGMILRSYRFLDLETPVDYMDSWITPEPHFYVRNHMHMPGSVDSPTWKLSISGEVENPISLDLDELSKFPSLAVTNTLECAGNGRAFQRPIVPGVQWQRGAVSTGRFQGPRLRDVLLRAGVKPSGSHVSFRGLDQVPGKVPPFVRSIPIEKAMDADTIIATHMNGAPLTRYHGFPARALVPGWIGAASCKWLSEIHVIEKEFEGNFMKPGYRFPNHPVQPGGSVSPDETTAITALSVKSIITGPSEGAKLNDRGIRVHGAAWAGEADIVKVEVSTDSGETWHAAQLGSEHARYAWRLWTHPWKPAKPGDYAIMSRATDSQGRTQPESAAWNPSGYLYNAIDKVNVHVQG
jgi:sulfite oxidase